MFSWRRCGKAGHKQLHRSRCLDMRWGAHRPGGQPCGNPRPNAADRALFALACALPSSAMHRRPEPGFAAGGAALSPAERAGREIWFFATAFNDRFYTYSYPQRLGAAIDWFKILGADRTGTISSRPGARSPIRIAASRAIPNCPATSLDGDLRLPVVPGRRRACCNSSAAKATAIRPATFADSPFDASTPHGVDRPAPERLRPPLRHLDRRARPAKVSQSALRRGQVAGAQRIAGELGGLCQAGVGNRRAARTRRRQPALRRLGRAAVPHRHGLRRLPHRLRSAEAAGRPEQSGLGEHRRRWSATSTAACRRCSASGMSQHRLEWQLIARTRPGVVDTSALPMDTVSNPGTMNAIINFARRPLHEHRDH